jgi:hypothetical protein
VNEIVKPFSPRFSPQVTHRSCDALRGRGNFFIARTSGRQAATPLVGTECIRVDVVAEEREQPTNALTFALVINLTLTAVGNRFLERFLRRLRLRVLLRRIRFRFGRLAVDLSERKTKKNSMKRFSFRKTKCVSSLARP